MSKLAIVTDSCASIPDGLIKKLGIEWVPYYIHRGREVLRDLVTAQTDTFYEWMRSANTLPTTAAPGPGDYLAKYQALTERGVREIISVHMTSKGSGAYQAAVTAKEMLLDKVPGLKIDVIDTLNVAMCHGWIAVEAARDALAGSSRADILQHIKAMKPRVHMAQTADTLRYLALGGRIGRATQLVGSLLNIKPIIGMEQGEIVALGKARSRSRAYDQIAGFVEKAAAGFSKIKAAFVHAAAPEEAERLHQLVEARVNCAESLIAELSPALGVHSGPGTVGICYLLIP
ncbi:MAG: DegV family protein [Anaerolineales bacterium]|jgi:DegV family protein with EDD domain